MDFMILDIWNEEVSASTVFEACLSVKNTHIIVDCSKESALSYNNPNSNKPFQLENEAFKVIDHNERYGNRVDIILGNYKPISEEYTEDDISIEKLDEVETRKKQNVELESEGNPPIQPIIFSGASSALTRLNFFDNVYHWPTYFLVWNGTKVAAPALKKLKQFPVQQLTKLFYVKNRVAKEHRVLLLNNLARYGLLEPKNFSMLDPHDQIEEILSSVTREDGSDDTKRFYEFGATKNNDVPEVLYVKPPEDYHSALIDIVTETSLVSTFRTEKCVWPLVYMKPFVILGARYINHNLQKYGFELYDELIDYTFDTIESPRERVKAMAQEMRRLSELKLDLNKQLMILKPKIERNLKNYLELCFKDPYLPSIIKDLGNNEDILKLQQYGKGVKRDFVNAENGSWLTYAERNGGNGEIIDIVRNNQSEYLHQIMNLRDDNPSQINIQTKENTMENNDHEGSLGTDRNPPAGTEEEKLAKQEQEQEELLKKRIEELRKRDPFIYR
jgi:hypothetical protein